MAARISRRPLRTVPYVLSLASPDSAGQKLNGDATSKAPGPKRQKQHPRLRKEKPQQHAFAHPLLAAALKVSSCACHAGSLPCACPALPCPLLPLYKSLQHQPQPRNV